MISKEEVKHIAKLSRLELTEQEVVKMQKDLSSILDYFNLLKKVPKLKVGGGQTSTKVLSSTREDKVSEKNSTLANNLIQAAPDKKENYIKVKQIL